MARTKKTPAPEIDKDRVLAALKENPQATKRDLVRLMGIKGADRIRLKRLLKDLNAEGLIQGSRKTGYARPGMIPKVAVLEVNAPDDNGDLTAHLMRWEGEEAQPKIYVQREAGAKLGEGTRILARMEQVSENEYSAKLIRALGKPEDKMLAVVRIENGHARAVPVERKSKEYAIDAHDLNGAENNDLIMLEPVPGRRIAGWPRARVLEDLGSLDAPRSVSLIAIHQHGIPYEFPEEAVAEARAAKPVTALDGRTDLRKVPLVTIDPDDARDFDDAVWAGPDPDNKDGFQVMVAIADVAHYVTPGSALDREAYKRGNSVYFPDRVVPMLPEELSNGLCSLNPDEDRPCMAVRMRFDAHGKMLGHTFFRGLMRSAGRLTYTQAQHVFENREVDIPDAARKTLHTLWDAYQKLCEAREKRAPLALNVPERKITIDDAGHVSSIAFKVQLESMKLIEECMVLANVAAAETLEKHKQDLIYRVHESPSQEKLSGFAEYLHSIDVPYARGQVIKPVVFNRILERAKGGPNEQSLNDMVLRTQAQAVYDPVNVGHFGLNLARYAHFTSPIRRYADTVVHRALIRALKLGRDGLTDKEQAKLSITAEHISVTERRAMEAERDSTDRYVAAHMADHLGAVFEGRIATVTKFGLFIRLADTGAEGLLPARMLGADYYSYDERKQALIGERKGITYRLGETIEVRLVEVEPVTGSLRFDLAEMPKQQRRPAHGPRKVRRIRPRKKK